VHPRPWDAILYSTSSYELVLDHLVVPCHRLQLYDSYAESIRGGIKKSEQSKSEKFTK
jgi:hypothetical protein